MKWSSPVTSSVDIDRYLVPPCPPKLTEVWTLDLAIFRDHVPPLHASHGVEWNFGWGCSYSHTHQSTPRVTVALTHFPKHSGRPGVDEAPFAAYLPFSAFAHCPKHPGRLELSGLPFAVYFPFLSTKHLHFFTSLE